MDRPKITGNQHNGTINVSSGTVKMEGGTITAGEFTIDMTSIKDLDLPSEGDYNNAKLKATSKALTFLMWKTIQLQPLVVTGVEAVNDGGPITHNIKGNLTIKGITKEILVPAAVTVGDGTLNAEANFSFDRAQFDVRYGSGSFFEDLGDNMINDEVKLELVLVATANEA
ncbi:MAG: YceI family protein [Bacteroidia bacterium]